MTALDKVPTNVNMISKLSFAFFVKKLPNVNFFLQSVQLPELILPPTYQPNPLVRIPIPGDHIEYGDLEIEFKVDRNLKNYNEIYKWIRGMGFPENTDEYALIRQQEIRGKLTGEGIHSDVTLLMLSNLKHAKAEIVFREAFPYYLSGLQFSTKDSTVTYVTASAKFKYILFDLNPLP